MSTGMQGARAFQDKVSRMLKRQDKRPVLKPNKPLVLRDEVGNKKMGKGEATCLTEMSVLVACWKENNFVEALCSSETQKFYKCVEAAKAASREKSQQETFRQGDRLDHKQANALLRKYPNLVKDI